MPTNVYCRLEKSYTCADKIVFLLGDTLVTLHWRRMFSAEIDSNLTFVGHLWRLWSGSVRYALSSCPVGIFALLCRDCSHKDRVGLGTCTERQSQFSVCIPDISNAVRPPWLVLWSSLWNFCLYKLQEHTSQIFQIVKTLQLALHLILSF